LRWILNSTYSCFFKKTLFNSKMIKRN